MAAEIRCAQDREDEHSNVAEPYRTNSNPDAAESHQQKCRSRAGQAVPLFPAAEHRRHCERLESRFQRAGFFELRRQHAPRYSRSMADRRWLNRGAMVHRPDILRAVTGRYTAASSKLQLRGCESSPALTHRA